MLITDGIIIITSHSIFFFLGWTFLHLVFLAKLKSYVPQLLFSYTLTLNCSMFQLIIFEIMGYMEPKTRCAYSVLS